MKNTKLERICTQLMWNLFRSTNCDRWAENWSQRFLGREMDMIVIVFRAVYRPWRSIGPRCHSLLYTHGNIHPAFYYSKDKDSVRELGSKLKSAQSINTIKLKVKRTKPKNPSNNQQKPANHMMTTHSHPNDCSGLHHAESQHTRQAPQHKTTRVSFFFFLA